MVLGGAGHGCALITMVRLFLEYHDGGTYVLRVVDRCRIHILKFRFIQRWRHMLMMNRVANVTQLIRWSATVGCPSCRRCDQAVCSQHQFPGCAVHRYPFIPLNMCRPLKARSAINAVLPLNEGIFTESGDVLHPSSSDCAVGLVLQVNSIVA